MALDDELARQEAELHRKRIQERVEKENLYQMKAQALSLCADFTRLAQQRQLPTRQLSIGRAKYGRWNGKYTLLRVHSWSGWVVESGAFSGRDQEGWDALFVSQDGEAIIFTPRRSATIPSDGPRRQNEVRISRVQGRRERETLVAEVILVRDQPPEFFKEDRYATHRIAVQMGGQLVSAHLGVHFSTLESVLANRLLQPDLEPPA